MDRVARSTDICAIHGFLRRVWIHRLRKQIHGYRRSTDCAQHYRPQILVVVCGGLQWFVVVCGGLWWFVVVCGGLRWFVF